MMTDMQMKSNIIFGHFHETEKPVQITFLKKNGDVRTMTILKDQRLIDQIIGCPIAAKATETMKKNNMYRVTELLVENGEMKSQWRVINLNTISEIKVGGNVFKFVI